MSFVERLSEQLERDFGPFPGPKSDLLAWVDDQINRCTLLGVPGEAALAMVNAGYLELCADLLEAPSIVFGAMPGLEVPDDFDSVDTDEIHQIFNGEQ
jgi:hypothetical protein